ncbi:MAG TPA: toprim domain-containing protein, partial [Streptosporangiaceae bacterium]|nr:toprim domain-containing protein [Streptosporangiaceae bacterium]
AHRRQAVIVEGYTDVMACHLAGVPTAVATCGTSFGDDHIKVLRRLVMDTDGATGEVIFTFDGDAAGQKAALRAFGMEERFVTQTFVTVQPDGLDPCDLRLKHGDAAVRDLIARRVPLFEFAIRNAVAKHNLDTAEGQIAALDEAAPIVARIKDSGLRTRYAVNLDRWLGLMDERFVLARVREHAARSGSGEAARNQGRSPRRDAARPGAAGHGAAGPAPGGPGNGPAAHDPRGRRAPSGAGEGLYDPSDPVVQVEREALKLGVQRPGLCGPEFDALGPEAFTAPAHAAVFGLIVAVSGTAAAGNAQEWVSRLLAVAPNDQARAFITRLAVEPLMRQEEPDIRYVDMVLARVGELAVSREIASVKSRLQRMNPVQQQTEYNQLFGDLVALEQRRKALLDRAAGA